MTLFTDAPAAVLIPRLPERPGDLLRDVLVLERRERRERLQDGDLGAERPVERRELEADGTRADHDRGAGDPVVPECLVARDDPLGQLEPREQSRTRSARDDDVAGVDFGAVDLDRGPWRAASRFP